MAKYRQSLPQLEGKFFLTDGGIETTLIFHDGKELPHFASFHLFKTRDGEETLKRYFRTYAEMAQKYQTGLLLETPTWRASAEWGNKLAYSREALVEINKKGVHLLEDIRDECETPKTPIVISGCIGPRGDGYVPTNKMSAKQAEEYHSSQVDTFASTSVDLVSGLTLNYVEEAIGLVNAARKANLPVVISFTVETDGNLPTGQALGEAVENVDQATDSYPSYFMINCAHPSHFRGNMVKEESWMDRIRGLRANASKMSHAELNDAPVLDPGDPVELGQDYSVLKRRMLKSLNVFGGCCGTDHRHVEHIALACLPLFRRES
jgi:homocysteine S-methyltransferase